VFAIYCDMGASRWMHKLAELLKVDHPELAVTRTSLERWSRTHDWQAGLKVADKAIAQGRVQALTPPQARMFFDPEFDQVEALLSAANQALQRAMNASPVVTKPSDVKALVDSAANALKLVETIKTNQVAKCRDRKRRMSYRVSW
jgi:ABC-type proline/glycine betaine transport system ATPase subunit